MGLYSEYDAELQADIEFGGVPLTILSDIHPKMKAVDARLTKKYQHVLASGNVPPEMNQKIELEKMSVAVAGFPKPDRVTDREGKPIPYSRENVVTLLTDLPWLLQDILWAVRRKEAFRKEAQAALGEDSAPPSVLT